MGLSSEKRPLLGQPLSPVATLAFPGALQSPGVTERPFSFSLFFLWLTHDACVVTCVVLHPRAGSSAQDVSQTLLKQSDGPTIPGASHEESKDELVFGENSSIDPKLVTASVFSSLFNLTNTIIGAGVRLHLLPGLEAHH